MKVSIFTPTYNRAYILNALYDSLVKQTNKDFEWIIVDDGSTDNTEELVKNLCKNNNDFSIVYKKVDNGGKHRAINIGAQLAKGELFFIVDSDDKLPKESIEIILEIYNTIPPGEKVLYAGLCGLRGSKEGYIGQTFKGDIKDLTYLESKFNNISGDKADIYFTEIIKKYPFPTYENEKFIPESVVWNTIAEDGLKLRYFNKIVYYCEYLQDGLSAMGDKKIVENPRGYGLFLNQQIKFGVINKMYKWNALYDYYQKLKGHIGVFKIAKYLGFNPIKFAMRMMGLKVFYKLYK